MLTPTEIIKCVKNKKKTNRFICIPISTDMCPPQFTYLSEVYSCYKFNFRYASGGEAWTICQMFGGYPVAFDTKQEFETFKVWHRTGNTLPKIYKIIVPAYYVSYVLLMSIMRLRYFQLLCFTERIIPPIISVKRGIQQSSWTSGKFHPVDQTWNWPSGNTVDYNSDTTGLGNYLYVSHSTWWFHVGNDTLQLPEAHCEACKPWHRNHLIPVRDTFKLSMMTSSNGNIFRVTGPLCGGIHRSPVNSPHKGQWRGALIFSFSLICVSINGWVNNRKAGDLRRHRARCDVTVMPPDHHSEGYMKSRLVNW